MKGLADGKYLGGQKGGQHVHKQVNLQQAKESGWHWRFEDFKLNFFSRSILELTQILQTV